MEKPMSCPFCGEQATRVQNEHNLNWFICCVECKCSTSLYVNVEDAIKAWNTRRVAPIERIIEELAHLYETEPLIIAKLCDDVLDKSGRLLGDVRVARWERN